MIRTHFVVIPHALILYGYVERWRSYSLSSKRGNFKGWTRRYEMLSHERHSDRLRG